MEFMLTATTKSGRKVYISERTPGTFPKQYTEDLQFAAVYDTLGDSIAHLCSAARRYHGIDFYPEANQQTISEAQFNDAMRWIEAEALRDIGSLLECAVGEKNLPSAFENATKRAKSLLPAFYNYDVVHDYDYHLRQIIRREAHYAIQSRIQAKRESFARNLNAIISQ